jgi:predicted nuclease with TOPRIM domain
MTEEYINPENVELPEKVPEKDEFEAKLNEVEESLVTKDEEIASLKEQMAALQARLDELLMKQQEAEKEESDRMAEEDFQAFGQKLNAAHRKDARVHYDNFLKTGWKYIAANPEVFKMDIPKMNARGIPEEGEAVSELSKARAELQKTLSSNYRRK